MFEEGNFIEEEEEKDIEKQEIKNNIYEKARELADEFFEKFKFVEKENIIKVEANAEQKKDETPVFFSPGWGVKGNSESIVEILKIIANEGRDVISTSFEGEQKIVESENKEDIPIAELQKALAIIQSIDEMEIDKVDAIGHSEGGLTLAIAACLYPEKFRNLVFVSPAGMVGEDSYLDLIKRFTIDEAIEEMKNRKWQNMNSFSGYIKEVFSYVVKNPALSLKEVKAMTEMDIFEMTKYLKDQGIGVGLVCGTNDRVFPIEDVIANVSEENIDYFLSTKGDHGSLVFNREHGLLAEDLLENMARKKEKP